MMPARKRFEPDPEISPAEKRERTLPCIVDPRRTRSTRGGGDTCRRSLMTTPSMKAACAFVPVQRVRCADLLSRRRSRHARARGKPALQSRVLPHLCRGATLGRPDAARRAIARVPAVAESVVVSHVQSKDRTTMAYEAITWRTKRRPEDISKSSITWNEALSPALGCGWACYTFQYTRRRWSHARSAYNSSRLVTAKSSDAFRPEARGTNSDE